MKVEWKDYDFVHVGVSGGKDSTATLLWLVHESGCPAEKIKATFCDTGNEDAITYAFLDMLHDKVCPILRIAPSLDFWDLARKKKRFPGAKSRFCTQELKIFPSRDYVRHLMGQGEVLLLSGIRKAEGHSGNNRGELSQFEWDSGYGCDSFRPLIDWSIDDVWAIHKHYLKVQDVGQIINDDPKLSGEHKELILSRLLYHGIPRNPLYDMGAVRVGCFPCIMSRKAEIRAMAKFRPERIDYIEQQERSVNPSKGISSFFPRNTVPERHRSKLITAESGEQMRVCTIRDVVGWSQTAYGGKQYALDFEEEFPPMACEIGGMCE